jgi:hypothetical protein
MVNNARLRIAEIPANGPGKQQAVCRGMKSVRGDFQLSLAGTETFVSQVFYLGYVTEWRKLDNRDWKHADRIATATEGENS